jgi:hypothetical protein
MRRTRLNGQIAKFVDYQELWLLRNVRAAPRASRDNNDIDRVETPWR